MTSQCSEKFLKELKLNRDTKSHYFFFSSIELFLKIVHLSYLLYVYVILDCTHVSFPICLKHIILKIRCI